jgi:hypothetical protein
LSFELFRHLLYVSIYGKRYPVASYNKTIYMKDLKISIPKPCHENWDKMTLADQGRHCAACATTVVDFSRMSTEEIQHFFLTKKEVKVCGHFKASQLDEKISGLQKYLSSVYERIENKLAGNILKTASLICLALLINLSGCLFKPTPKMGKVKAKTPEERMLKGDVDIQH